MLKPTPKEAEKFFDLVGDQQIALRGWEVEYTISVEGLYQYFKARMVEEAKEQNVCSGKCKNCGGCDEG